MKIKLFFCLLLFLLSTQKVDAQEKFTISGYVKNSINGEALIGARIYIDKLQLGAITNVYGFYSLTIPAGTHEILYSFVGFEVIKKGVILDENLTLDINLKEGATLDAVTVMGEEKQHQTTEVGTVTLDMNKVKSLPVLLGEVDIIKTAQLLPGIQSGSEGASGIYVRGGGPDQNLILLDGVPIYNANHLFGFFSVFNADAINSVKIIKGGMPARYGGRLSSVLDIRMNDGDMKKIHGEGSIGLISSKLMLNGPIIKDKTSFMISARRTYIDILAKPFIAMANKSSSDSKTSGGYYFYDVNLKLNHIINKNNRIYFSSYLGNDRFYADSESKYKTYDQNQSNPKTFNDQENLGLQWGNKIMALRWNHQYGPKLFSNTTLNFSNYQFKTGISSRNWEEGNENSPNEDFSFAYLSGIVDWGGKIDFFYYPVPNHKINFGIGETYHTFTPGANELKSKFNGNNEIDTTFGADKTYGHEFYGFIEDDFEITKRLSANIGLHFSNFYVRQKYYTALQPRAAFNFKLNEKSSVKLSYSRNAQYLHLLSNTSIGLPTDLWVPVTDSIPPQLGNQISAGYFRELPKGYRLSTEAYYKTMDNIIEYKEGSSFFNTNKSWEEMVEVGKGWSYGAEVLLEKTTGKTTGWIGYTLSWTNRQFENLNNGNVYPFRYDRRHDISVAITHKFNDKVDIGVVWVYGTGNAVTLATQNYNALPSSGNVWGSQTIEYIDDKNGYRMPAYHRLDVGLNLHKTKKWGEATWSFGIYNAYNNQNPFFLSFGYLPNNPNKVLKQTSLFPIIPSVSYNFKF